MIRGNIWWIQLLIFLIASQLTHVQKQALFTQCLNKVTFLTISPTLYCSGVTSLHIAVQFRYSPFMFAFLLFFHLCPISVCSSQLYFFSSIQHLSFANANANFIWYQHLIDVTLARLELLVLVGRSTYWHTSLALNFEGSQYLDTLRTLGHYYCICDGTIRSCCNFHAFPEDKRQPFRTIKIAQDCRLVRTCVGKSYSDKSTT